jgi:hypothetical protein
MLVKGQSTSKGREWYVAPEGSTRGAGTYESPLDLRSALSKQSPARPGDTVWLKGGVYRGRFDSFLLGTSSAPIIVRQLPGHRATIDSNDGTLNPVEGALSIRSDGGYVWYWGFEVMNSDSKRTSAADDAFPHDLYRANGVNVYASNVKLINMVIHDVDNGVFVGDLPHNVEINGLLSYYNGHDGADSAWGHGIYVQNQWAAEPRVIRDAITASNFSHGLHAYGGADRGLNAIRLEGNISFQNGILSRFHLARNLLLGGLAVARGAAVINNYTYYSRPDGENNLGYSAGAPGAVVTGNYFVSGRQSLVWVGPSASVMADNVFFGLTTPATLTTTFPSNTYYGNRRPTNMWYFVRPNQYEAGRANVAVYNWPRESEVSIDLSSTGLRSGSRYEIRDVHDYFGTPVVSDIYDGKPVTLPLAAREVARPAGNIPTALPVHTLPEFGAFVVLPVYARPR